MKEMILEKIRIAHTRDWANHMPESWVQVKSSIFLEFSCLGQLFTPKKLIKKKEKKEEEQQQQH